MKRLGISFAAVCLFALAIGSFATGQEKPVVAQTNIKVGDVAPDFTLLSNEWKPVKLSDYHGKKNVILAFYVLAFTGG